MSFADTETNFIVLMHTKDIKTLKYKDLGFFNHSVVFKVLSMTNYLTESKKILHDKIVFKELSETIFKTVLSFFSCRHIVL